MQNKPNLLDAQMNVSFCFTMNYEQITMNNANKNKPNSKPKQTQTKPIYPYRSRIKANSNPNLPAALFGGLSVKKLTDFPFDFVAQNRYSYAQLFCFTISFLKGRL